MGFLEERDLSDIPTIPEFYKGKTIFITGGSGFMGQVLIEKLLYSCSDLSRIYVLIRQKRGADAHQRLAELYSDSSSFDRLKAERPGLFETKVHAVSGDIALDELGMSKEDQEILKDCVNIIFHCAASVRFTDNLKQSSNTNIKSTRDLVHLAAGMKNLLAFVHVSTCYANTNYSFYLEERMYPPHTNWRETIDICENIDLNIIETLTAKYIGDLPNTYIFTKQLAEHLVFEQKGKLPAVIIRPSIVTYSVNEPFKGWINNFNGPIAVFVGIGKGIIRDVLGYRELQMDYIPVDYCIKHFIVAAWIRGTKSLESTDEVPIYHCSACKELEITIGDLSVTASRYTEEYPFDSMINTPIVSLTRSPFLHYIKFLVYQLLPAILFDILLWLFGKKTFFVKIQRRVYQGEVALEHFMTNYWYFDNRNFLLLLSCIKEEDKEQFDYNLRLVDKGLYMKSGVIGSRKYLLKEKIEEYPKARRHYFWVKLIHATFKVLLLISLIWIFI